MKPLIAGEAIMTIPASASSATGNRTDDEPEYGGCVERRTAGALTISA